MTSVQDLTTFTISPTSASEMRKKLHNASQVITNHSSIKPLTDSSLTQSPDTKPVKLVYRSTTFPTKQNTEDVKSDIRISTFSLQYSSDAYSKALATALPYLPTSNKVKYAQSKVSNTGTSNNLTSSFTREPHVFSKLGPISSPSGIGDTRNSKEHTSLTTAQFMSIYRLPTSPVTDLNLLLADKDVNLSSMPVSLFGINSTKHNFVLTCSTVSNTVMTSVQQPPIYSGVSLTPPYIATADTREQTATLIHLEANSTSHFSSSTKTSTQIAFGKPNHMLQNSYPEMFHMLPTSNTDMLATVPTPSVISSSSQYKSKSLNNSSTSSIKSTTTTSAILNTKHVTIEEEVFLDHKQYSESPRYVLHVFPFW